MLEFDFWKALLRILIFLPLVLIFALLFIKFFLSHKTFSFHRGYLQVMEQIGIGNKASLAVVKIGEDYFLFSVTENQIQMLNKLPDYLPPQGNPSGSQTFAQVFTKLRQRREADKP